MSNVASRLRLPRTSIKNEASRLRLLTSRHPYTLIRNEAPRLRRPRYSKCVTATRYQIPYAPTPFEMTTSFHPEPFWLKECGSPFQLVEPRGDVGDVVSFKTEEAARTLVSMNRAHLPDISPYPIPQTPRQRTHKQLDKTSYIEVEKAIQRRERSPRMNQTSAPCLQKRKLPEATAPAPAASSASTPAPTASSASTPAPTASSASTSSSSAPLSLDAADVLRQGEMLIKAVKTAQDIEQLKADIEKNATAQTIEELTNAFEEEATASAFQAFLQEER